MLFRSNNALILADTTKNWTPNQWVNTEYPYVLYDAKQGIGAVITANTANTITFSGSFSGFPGNNSSGSMLINTGDSYEIRQVFATLDQCGFGQGDLLTGAMPINTATGTAAWPHEVSDPVYAWGNDFTTVVQGFGSYLVSGGVGMNNYVTGIPKPGYTPLPYPHPLVSGTNYAFSAGTNTYLLTVNGGTGGGYYPAGMTVNIAANDPPSGQIFVNWSGDTSYLANAATATTYVSIPPNALTVTANYGTPGTNTTAVVTPPFNLQAHPPGPSYVSGH